MALGERSYDVLVGPGLTARAGELIKDRVGPVKCGIVTDRTVAAHHLPAVEAALRGAGMLAGTVTIEAGESAKSFPVLASLCERLLGMGLERRDCIVALGGGVIGDLAGFAASIARRGVAFVQMPTTLLAQVDSSVGGKTAINTAQGKNLIGTFHQPRLVLADTDLLSTLPARQFRAGYVEAAKFGLLGHADYFAWLEQNGAAVFARDEAALTHAIAVAVQGKAGIVARDETETGERMLLNLGHTFGHALEAWAGFSERLLHGEAISIGICLAFRLSQELGFVGNNSVARVEAHFAGLGLPTRIADIPGSAAPEPGTLVAIMGQDKKVREGRLTLILARGIGEAFITRDVPAGTVHDFLARQIDGSAGAP
ncbi:MAG TPA: 3-dehydroquinate synthase [Hyphomicrobiaceae bacterium]|nr:3-dehydroquinate synthase [Hyphomicrobiaceae bacterium]